MLGPTLPQGSVGPGAVFLCLLVEALGAAFGFDAPFILNGITSMPAHRINIHDRLPSGEPCRSRVPCHSANSVLAILRRISTDLILGPIYPFSCGGNFPSASRFQGDTVARNM